MTFREVKFMLGRNSVVDGKDLVTVEIEELTLGGSTGVENGV